MNHSSPVKPPHAPGALPGRREPDERPKKGTPDDSRAKPRRKESAKRPSPPPPGPHWLAVGLLWSELTDRE
jgi:hypothetical protein